MAGSMTEKLVNIMRGDISNEYVYNDSTTFFNHDYIWSCRVNSRLINHKIFKYGGIMNTEKSVMQCIEDEGYLIKLFDDFLNGYVTKFEVYPSALKLIEEDRISLQRVKEIAWYTCKIPQNVVDDRLAYMTILKKDLTK